MMKKVKIFAVILIIFLFCIYPSFALVNEGKISNFSYSTNFLLERSNLKNQSFSNIKEINYNNSFGNFNFQNYGIKFNNNKKFFFFFDIKDIDFINKRSFLEANRFYSLSKVNEILLNRTTNFNNLYFVNSVYNFNTYNFNTFNLKFSSVYNLRGNIYIYFSTSFDVNKDLSNFSFSNFSNLNKSMNSELKIYIKF